MKNNKNINIRIIKISRESHRHSKRQIRKIILYDLSLDERYKTLRPIWILQKSECYAIFNENNFLKLVPLLYDYP
jgi:hypothetical protein